MTNYNQVTRTRQFAKLFIIRRNPKTAGFFLPHAEIPVAAARCDNRPPLTTSLGTDVYETIKWLHLAGAIVWMGGMAFVLWALRPSLGGLAPDVRATLIGRVLSRFFTAVWLCIAVLLASGLWMLLSADMRLAPKGWHAMSGLGALMCLIFAHIWFAPYRQLRRALAQADWAQAGQALARIHPLVVTNFCLGWLAVAAVIVWR